MTNEMVTAATGTSLQRLAEAAWARVGGESKLHFEDQSFAGGQLAERTRRLSQGLREAGLRPGERVVVCMANCPEVGLTYNAVWRAGAATTPVLFLLSEEELRHVLVDSAAAFVVTTPDFLPKVLAAAGGVDTLRGVIVAGAAGGDTGTGGSVEIVDLAELEQAPEGDLVDREPAELAALLYTGGTTGRSKGVMLSHDALSSAAWALLAAGKETERSPTTSTLLPLPLSHVYGLMLSVGALHATEGSTSVLMRWFDPVGWLQLAERHRTQASALVPSMIQMLLAHPIEDYDLSALRRLGSGGASLAPEVADELMKRLPQVEITEGYGCTETGGSLAANRPGEARLGSVGKPLPLIDVRLEKADGTQAGRGEDGEICVRGPNVMTGYWQAPEETAKVLRDGWFHTGDVGRFDDDGYLYVVDRIKDLIIRGGINVYPRDVEDALLEHPDIVGAGVVGKPDPRLGEEVVAFVQLRPEAAVTPEDIVAFAKSRLSAAKYPRDVRIVDALPLTSVFKLDRKALRTRL
ncbi:MAG TPA: AMP-binding protein [Mycobacteriales bacterium]|nr:AMP-binding protein [Mycobacteriales bacterium]